jgi:predicted DCC family thiol-disulfide oxidoreductase YuxK
MYGVDRQLGILARPEQASVGALGADTHANLAQAAGAATEVDRLARLAVDARVHAAAFEVNANVRSGRVCLAPGWLVVLISVAARHQVAARQRLHWFASKQCIGGLGA